MRKVFAFILFCVALVGARPVLAAPNPNDPVLYSALKSAVTQILGLTGTGARDDRFKEAFPTAETLTDAILQLKYTAGSGIDISNNVISLKGLPEPVPGDNGEVINNDTSVYVYQGGQFQPLDMAKNWGE